MKKFRTDLNEKGEKHAALVIVKNFKNLKTLNLEAFFDDINSKISQTNSLSYEIDSFYTKDKKPYVIEFENEHFNFLEIEENE